MEAKKQKAENRANVRQTELTVLLMVTMFL